MKKAIEAIVSLIILLFSIIAFPLLQFILGHGRDIWQVLVSAIFILIWLLLLLYAVKFKSKILLHVYCHYWRITAVAILLIIVIGYGNHLVALLIFLAIIFLSPIAGFGYFTANLNASIQYTLVITFSVATTLFFIGRRFKKRLFPKLQEVQKCSKN